jgi:hypothetical protein
MAEFRVIDADSHVEEPAEAWGYLDPKYEARRPFPITGENRPFLHNMNSFWYIDGSVYPKVAGTRSNDLRHPSHHGAREAQALHPG